MNQKLIEKIQKLLALAESPNEHEARLASEMAQKLLTMHNLDMQQIEGHVSDYDSLVVDDSKVAPQEAPYISILLTDFFFVKVIKSRDRSTKRTRRIMVGEKTNLQVAKHVRAYLMAQYRIQWEKYRAENNAPLKARHSYYTGLTEGLTQQLQSARAAVCDERGLVLVKDPGIDEAAAKLFENLGKSSIKMPKGDAQALMKGFISGVNMKISTGEPKPIAQNNGIFLA